MVRLVDIVNLNRWNWPTSPLSLKLETLIKWAALILAQILFSPCTDWIKWKIIRSSIVEYKLNKINLKLGNNKTKFRKINCLITNKLAMNLLLGWIILMSLCNHLILKEFNLKKILIMTIYKILIFWI